MQRTLLDGPAAEPLALDDVKAHLRLDGDDEDDLLGSLIATSRSHVEAALGLALMTQSWRWHADCWPPAGLVDLMTRPLQRVTRVAVRRSANEQIVVDSGAYVVDTASGRVAHRNGSWPVPGVPVAGIEIDFTAGYGDGADAVPKPIRQALRLLVAHWYEVRNPVHIGAPAARVPDTVSELLMPYRMRRL